MKRDNKVYSMPTRHEGVCEGIIYYEPTIRKELIFVADDDTFRKDNGSADEFARNPDGFDMDSSRNDEVWNWRKVNNDLDNDRYADEDYASDCRDPEQPVKYLAEDLEWVNKPLEDYDEI